MDNNQLTQLVQYYDEERRKDRTMMLQLQERVESLTREVEARSRINQSLEQSLAEMRTQMSRALGWTTAIEQARAEFGQGIGRIEDQRSKAERESARVRQIETEALTRQINEIKKEIKPYPRYADDLESRKLEDARLAELIGRLQVQLTDIERRVEQPGAAIAYLEEQRRQDNRRITDHDTQLQEARRRIEQFAPQLLLLDEQLRKKQSEIEEAAKLLQAQSQLLENQRVADVRRERQFADYADTVERIKQRTEEISNQATGFIQLREEVRRELTGLPEFEDRQEARINEVFELQRDAEERAKRQAEGFRDKLEKIMKDFTVQQEERWHERDRRISEHDARLDEIDNELAKMPPLQPVYNILETFAKYNAAVNREWLAQSNALIDQARKELPSDEQIRLSRRQRRKQQTQTEAEVGQPQKSAQVEITDDDLLE